MLVIFMWLMRMLQLSWTFEKEGMTLLWRWKCLLSPDSKKSNVEILDFLMGSNINLSVRFCSLTCTLSLSHYVFETGNFRLTVWHSHVCFMFLCLFVCLWWALCWRCLAYPLFISERKWRRMGNFELKRIWQNKILTMFLKVIFFPFYFLFYQIKKMYLSLSAFPVLYIFLSSKQNIKENV